MTPKLMSKWQQTDILEAVFDQLSDGLVLYDQDMIVTGVNRAAENLLGMSSDEMIGRICNEVFRCATCDHSCGMLVGLGQPSVASTTLRIHSPSGRERMAVIRTNQIYNTNGTLAGAVATIRDITEQASPQHRTVIAESPAMREVLHFLRKVAASEASTILLEGENGTGKDLIAKTLHYQSLRQAEPFVAINCAAIPETLLESELFGFERGAFTDARAQKKGIFELADRGTLLLDEIGELPLVLQAKLLRVLEEQSFRRLGGLKDIDLNLRFVAATNKNLKEAVKDGSFRQDLYYRLNVIRIVIPPLRERREDIVPLADLFIRQYNRKFRRNVEGLSPDTIELLENHAWPGNVRELRNAIERAMILEESGYVTPSSLPMEIAGTNGNGRVPMLTAASIPDEGISLAEQERLLLVRALEKTGGNQTQAARLLHITRDTLRYKMKKFKLR